MAATITGWRAYFINGAIYTSKTTPDWIMLPTDGLLGLVTFYSDGTKRRVTGGDYFYYDPSAQKAGMDKGTFTDVSMKYPGSYYIRGKWTNDEAMKAMEARMKSDASP